MFEQTSQLQSEQKIENSALNITDAHLLEQEKGLSDELGDDELEQVSGGLGPLAAAGLIVGGAVAATFVVGAVKGFMDGETDEADRCHGRQ
jgi:lactobin A/cerein 7B family class IIb bacteriocin